MGRYERPVCRGCWALGNNCGRCERCLETKPASPSFPPSPAEGARKEEGDDGPPPALPSSDLRKKSEGHLLPAGGRRIGGRHGASQLRLRPFRYADLDQVAPREDFAAELAQVSRAQRMLLALSWGFTLERGADLHPRTVLACGGARERRPGCWTAWMVADDLTVREWRLVLDGGQRLFAFLEETVGAQLIDLLVRQDFIEGARFARKLGFWSTADLSERGGVIYRTMRRGAG